MELLVAWKEDSVTTMNHGCTQFQGNPPDALYLRYFSPKWTTGRHPESCAARMTSKRLPTEAALHQRKTSNFKLITFSSHLRCIQNSDRKSFQQNHNHEKTLSRLCVCAFQQLIPQEKLHWYRSLTFSGLLKLYIALLNLSGGQLSSEDYQVTFNLDVKQLLKF